MNEDFKLLSNARFGFETPGTLSFSTKITYPACSWQRPMYRSSRRAASHVMSKTPLVPLRYVTHVPHGRTGVRGQYVMTPY